MSRQIIFALLLLLVLLVAGCTQVPSTQNAGEVVKYVCSDGKTTVTDITTCPASTAVVKEQTEEEKALDVCSGMPSMQYGSYEDLCIIGLAGKFKNTELCEEVIRDQRTTCYKIVAVAKNDPDVCNEAESMADQCYQEYALEKKDILICAKIASVDNKDSCYDNLANQLADPTGCSKIMNVSRKDNCYSNMAMRLGDSSYCDSITNSDQKQSCQNNIQNNSGVMGGIPSKYQ